MIRIQIRKTGKLTEEEIQTLKLRADRVRARVGMNVVKLS